MTIFDSGLYSVIGGFMSDEAFCGQMQVSWQKKWTSWTSFHFLKPWRRSLGLNQKLTFVEIIPNQILSFYHRQKIEELTAWSEFGIPWFESRRGCAVIFRLIDLELLPPNSSTFTNPLGDTTTTWHVTNQWGCLNILLLRSLLPNFGNGLSFHDSWAYL